MPIKKDLNKKKLWKRITKFGNLVYSLIVKLKMITDWFLGGEIRYDEKPPNCIIFNLNCQITQYSMFLNPKIHTFKQRKFAITKTQLWWYTTVAHKLNKMNTYSNLINWNT